MSGLCASCNKPAETKCSRCQETYYCSCDCQKAHWATHKYICQKPSPTSDVKIQSQPEPAKRLAGGLDLLADVSKQLEKSLGFQDVPSSAPYHRAAKGGLHILWQVSKQFEEAEKLPKQTLPRLCAVIASEITEQKACNHFKACLNSIVKQWRAPPELIIISWHASSEFQCQLRAELNNFKAAVEDGGERVVYNGNQEHIVHNTVFILEQQNTMSQFEHFRNMLPHVPRSEDYWILLSSDAHIWHPARSAFMRNFTRQATEVAGCFTCALPLHLSLDSADACDSYTEYEEMNDLLKQGIARLAEVSCEIYQFCIRGKVLEEFFEHHKDPVVKHKLCYIRFISFVCHELKGEIQCINSPSPAMSQLKDSNLWVYFSRRRDSASQGWAHPARGNPASAEVLQQDVQLAEESLASVQRAVSSDITGSTLAQSIACWRTYVEFMVLKHHRSDPDKKRPAAGAALEHVDDAFTKDPEFVNSWMVPALERLIAEACSVFCLD